MCRSPGQRVDSKKSGAPKKKKKLRFANWLHNGQPTGSQGPGTTETGAYAITPGAVAAN